MNPAVNPCRDTAFAPGGQLDVEEVENDSDDFKIGHNRFLVRGLGGPDQKLTDALKRAVSGAPWNT